MKTKQICYIILCFLLLPKILLAQKKIPKKLFQDSGVTSIEIYDDGQYKYLKKKEISYATPMLSINDKNQYVVAKITKTIIDSMDLEFFKTNITLELYPYFSKKNIIRYSVKADGIEFKGDNQILFYETGCCGSDTKYTLYKFPQRVPFLVSTEKYFKISVPSTSDHYYCAFNWIDEKKQKLNPILFTELQFSTNETPAEIVKVFAKDKTTFDNLVYSNIEFIKKDSIDRIFENDTHFETEPIFYRPYLNTSSLNNFGFKLYFVHPKTNRRKEYQFLVKNGVLELPKEIIVEFD